MGPAGTPAAAAPPIPSRPEALQASGDLADRLLGAGLVLAIVGGVAQAVLHAANALTFDSDSLNANSEGNVFA